MIVTSLNSERRYAPFPHGVTGYRASRIEIDAHDIIAMRELAERDPPRFHAAMSQLAARFPFDSTWANMKIRPPREMLADDIGEYPALPCCGFRGPEGRHEHARDCDHFWRDGQPRYTGPV